MGWGGCCCWRATYILPKVAQHSQNGPAWFNAIPACDLLVLKENYHIIAFQHAQFPKISLQGSDAALHSQPLGWEVRWRSQCSEYLYIVFSRSLVFCHFTSIPGVGVLLRQRRSKAKKTRDGENYHPAWRVESPSSPHSPSYLKHSRQSRTSHCHPLIVSRAIIAARQTTTIKVAAE